MGFEDRDYYRDSYDDNEKGIPGFRFDRQSIITSLIVINVLVFLIDTFTNRYEAGGAIADGLGATVSGDGTNWLCYLLALKTSQPWQVWTFLTNGFAHASLGTQTGIFHIAVNMLTLFFLGRVVEERLGRFEFLRFYLIAIVVGSIAFYLLHLLTGQPAFIVGASGAISAVVIYFIFVNPKAELLMMGVIPMPAWVVGVMFLLMNLYHGLAQDHVAWEAHLAGGAFGAMYFYFNWNFSSLKMPSLFQGGAKLRVHRPDGEIDDSLQEEADRILAKISEQGRESLTRREQKTLERYSAAIRNSRK